MIKKKKNGPWVLWTSDGKRVLGVHTSKEDAQRQEAAIHVRKRAKRGY